jgi:hypothetical protein
MLTGMWTPTRKPNRPPPPDWALEAARKEINGRNGWEREISIIEAAAYAVAEAYERARRGEETP